MHWTLGKAMRPYRLHKCLGFNAVWPQSSDIVLSSHWQSIHTRWWIESTGLKTTKNKEHSDQVWWMSSQNCQQFNDGKTIKAYRPHERLKVNTDCWNRRQQTSVSMVLITNNNNTWWSLCRSCYIWFRHLDLCHGVRDRFALTCSRH